MANSGLPRSGVYVGLGANLPHPQHGPPHRTLRAAIAALAAEAGPVVAVSHLYRTAPVVRDPAARELLQQPAYANAVVELDPTLAPDALLAALHRIETAFGRQRSGPDAPRILDLDLLDYRGRIAQSGGPGSAALPHPRLHLRAFVLRPLLDVSPVWRHPVLDRSAAELLADVDPAQRVEPFDPD